MPRKSAAEKAETHVRILEKAAQSFRSHGGGVGIARVMADIGLTQGGFYRHFASKDELFVESVIQCLDEVAERLEASAEAAPEGASLRALIDTYLSSEHLEHPEIWCAFATLGPDMGRLNRQMHPRLERAIQVYTDRLSVYLPKGGVVSQSVRFFLLMSGMAGAMTMVRCFTDRQMQLQVLQITRDFYSDAFDVPGNP